MSKIRKSFSKVKNLLPFCILITILLIISGTYIYRGSFSEKRHINTSPKQLTTVNPVKTAKSESVPWKKYQGFGFTFEYPDGWKVNEINSWTKHEYNIYDPTSSYEVDYKGVAKSLFYSRSWNIMVFSEDERRNYQGQLLSPAQYAKFYCETVKTGTLMTSSSPQNSKDIFQAKCFTVADEYLIYNNNFFTTVLFRAYGGKEADAETTSRFLSSIKISEL